MNDGRRFLRILSGATLVLAMSSAIFTVIGGTIHLFSPGLFPWRIKSAASLILIGVSWASYQFAVKRPGWQLLLGLTVAAAFVLWGAEQYVSNRGIVSLIDDVVAFLFVLDLSIIIGGQLRRRPDGEKKAGS